MNKVTFLKGELFRPSDGLTILAAHSTREAVYMAVRQERATGHYPAGYVFGLVVKTEYRSKGDAYWGNINFYYKEMGEEMGPYYYDCPEKILRLLSDTDNPSALKWRATCRAQAARSVALGIPGSRILFSQQLKFPRGYGNTALFEVTARKGHFKAILPGGATFTCRLSRHSLKYGDWQIERTGSTYAGQTFTAL
jgi:hypothetical protein